MTPGNFNFLLYCIAAKLNYFKAVPKGRLIFWILLAVAINNTFA
jgi:hypothetical protein